MHLTDRTLRRLLDATMDPAEARALAAHLETECPRCEALLASGPADLDGRADRALTALAPLRPEEAGNELEYERILRKAHSGRSNRARWAPLVATVAAALAITVGGVVQVTVKRSTREAPLDGVKGVIAGPSRTVPVRLSAVAVLAEPVRQPRIWKVASGDVVPRGAQLQLRVDVGGMADLALARVGPAGEVDVFWHERVATAGPVQPSMAGRPAAYSLADLAGPQRFIVLASPEPIPPGRVATAARELSPPARIAGQNPALGDASADILEITVR